MSWPWVGTVFRLKSMNETRISDLRRLRGWTQEYLAEESGVAARTIQRLEAGNDANLETLSMVANALEVPVRDLFVSLEGTEFSTSVDGLDARTEYQQRSRASVEKGWRYLYRGVGFIVSLAMLISLNFQPLPIELVFVIPAYWIGGYFLFQSFDRMVLTPRLDAKYPLTAQRKAEPDMRQPDDASEENQPAGSNRADDDPPGQTVTE